MRKNCTGDTLTATRTFLSQLRHSRHACSRTHSPYFHDRTCSFGNRHELTRRDHRTIGQIPAQTKLHFARSEFVSAKARHKILFPDAMPQSLGDRLQDSVPTWPSESLTCLDLPSTLSMSTGSSKHCKSRAPREQSASSTTTLSSTPAERHHMCGGRNCRQWPRQRSTG